MFGFLKKRIFVSRIFGLILLVLLVLKAPDVRNEIVIAILSILGLVLVGIGALGRVWSSMYIYGYKTKTLVNEGPYSVVRNPLYCFSFISVMGIALASANLLFLLLIIGVYLIYYPFTVKTEEEELKKVLGKEYEEYLKSVPRFIPKISLLKIPEVYEVYAKAYSKTFLDTIWFFIIYGFVVLITILHLKEMLPTMF